MIVYTKMVHISINEVLKMLGTTVDRELYIVQKRGRGRIFGIEEFIVMYKNG